MSLLRPLGVTLLINKNSLAFNEKPFVSIHRHERNGNFIIVKLYIGVFVIITYMLGYDCQFKQPQQFYLHYTRLNPTPTPKPNHLLI